MGLLYLECPLEAEVQDRRVSIARCFCQVCVVSYIVGRSLLFWTVVEYETAVPFYNAWPSTAWGSGIPSADEPLCNGHWKHDFRPADPWTTGGVYRMNHSCPPYFGGEVFQQPGDEIRVALESQHFHRRRPGCGNGFPVDQVGAPNASAIFDEFYSRCMTSHYVRNAEMLPLFLIHTVSAQDLQIKKRNLRCLIVSSDGAQVLGEMSDKSTNGKGWMFTLSELLSYADGGVNIDSPNHGNNFSFFPPVGSDGNATPSTVALRFTGFILAMRFTYWNYAPIDGQLGQYWGYEKFDLGWSPMEPRCEVRVELQEQAWGFAGALESADGDIVYRNFARVKFIASGSFGRVSTQRMVLTLVEAIVLLGAANTVVAFLAEKFFGYEFKCVLTPDCKSAGHITKQSPHKSAQFSSKAVQTQEVMHITASDIASSCDDIAPDITSLHRGMQSRFCSIPSLVNQCDVPASGHQVAWV